jgi:hypothetical protein
VLISVHDLIQQKKKNSFLKPAFFTYFEASVKYILFCRFLLTLQVFTIYCNNGKSTNIHVNMEYFWNDIGEEKMVYYEEKLP